MPLSQSIPVAGWRLESYIALSIAPPITVIAIIHSGVIEVLDPNDNRLGFVSKNIREGGELIYDPSFANALVVTFATDQSTGYSTKLDITATVCFDPSIILDFSSHCPDP